MTLVIPIGDARSTEPTVANAAALPVASAEYLDQVRVLLDTGGAVHCHDPGTGIAWVPIAGSGGGSTEGLAMTVADEDETFPDTREITVQVTDGDGPGASPVAGVRRVGITFSVDAYALGDLGLSGQPGHLEVIGAGTAGPASWDLERVGAGAGFMSSTLFADTDATGLLEAAALNLSLTTFVSEKVEIQAWLYPVPGTSGQPIVTRIETTTRVTD